MSFPLSTNTNESLLNWDLNFEKMLDSWKTTCFIHMWLQSGSSYVCTIIYNILSYQVLIISSICGAVMFTENNSIMSIIAGSFTIYTVVLTAIIRQYRPSEKSADYHNAAKKYQNIIRHIQLILSQPLSMREKPNVVSERINLEMDALLDQQQEPLIFVTNKFKQRFGKSVDDVLYSEEIRNVVSTQIEANITSPKLPWRRLVPSLVISKKERKPLKTAMEYERTEDFSSIIVNGSNV